MKKTYPDADAAVDGLLFDGMTIAAGGFGLCGIPELLIEALRRSGANHPEVASKVATRNLIGPGCQLPVAAPASEAPASRPY